MNYNKKQNHQVIAVYYLKFRAISSIYSKTNQHPHTILTTCRKTQ